MPLPGNFSTVPVHGKYLDLAGAALAGTVTFTATPDALTDPAALIIIMSKPLVMTLDVNGEFTTNLPATDDPDIDPIGFTYKVVEAFPGRDVAGREYYITVPVASLPGGIDLTTAAPAIPVDGVARGQFLNDLGDVDTTGAVTDSPLVRDSTGEWVAGPALSATFAPLKAPAAMAALGTSVTANEDTAFRVCEYRGVVYVGMGWSQGGANIGGKVYAIDLVTGALTLAYSTGEQSVRSMAVYKDKLYVGTGIGGAIFSFDGTTWAAAHTFSGSQVAMAVYNGKLYIGETGTGLVHSFDGTTWATAVTTGDVHIESLCVFDGLLWIGTGNSPAAYHVWVYDGTNASSVYTASTTNKAEALALCPWRGKLYVSEFDPTGAPDLVEYDPATGLWTRYAMPIGSGAGTSTACYALAVYRDRLLIGTHPYADLFAFDGLTITLEGTGAGMQSLRDLHVVDERVTVAGRASGTPSTGGAVFTFGDGNRRRPAAFDTPPHVSSVHADAEWLGSFDPRLFTTSLTIPVANRAYFARHRVRKAVYIGHLRTLVSVASGNICLAVYKADGATVNTVDGVAIPGPGTRVVTTGSVVTPAAGVREIAVTTGGWLLPGDYWWYVGTDNTTAEVYGINGLTFMPTELTGFADTAFPAPSPAPALSQTGRVYPCWH